VEADVMTAVAPAARADRPGRGPALLPGREDLERIFRLKHGDPAATGWRPRLSYQLGYFTPDDHYEALLDRLVTPDTVWLDVGCGRAIFPENRPLARELTGRCALLVGADPDAAVEENPFAHRKFRGRVEEYAGPERFTLVTLRMVAEHITDPAGAVAALARLTAPGGRVVVYTVNRWSPSPLLTGAVPERLRHALKQRLWGSEERDTFPVAYRMNTRRRLARWFAAGGFRERAFAYLDDCRTLARWKAPHAAELLARRLLRAAGDLHYPENCLLGVYERA
jgi:SAM-dependent methyltransferase